MNKKIQIGLNTFMPFLILGVVISLLIGLVIMFSYILLWGLLIGSVLWLITLIKNFFKPSKKIKKPEGRVIEHSDKQPK